MYPLDIVGNIKVRLMWWLPFVFIYSLSRT